MPNNYDTVKLKAANEKFNLIRINPARSVESALTLDSGTTYTTTFAFSSVNSVKVDGVAYTLVSSSPSSGEYTFDQDTLLLTINLGAALSTQTVVVFYYLLYTNDKARITYEDPEDNTTTSRSWLPRLASEPSFNFNLKDINEGYLTASASSITLHNEDGNFQQYLTDNDSFANKEITIYTGLDSVDNIKLAYRGHINKIKVSRKVVISFYDEFYKLNRTLFSNGSYLNSTYNSTRFASLHPIKENLPIRKLYAEVTSYKVIDEGTAAGLYRINDERMLEAHCIDFNTTISTSNNRNWGTVLNEGDGGLQPDTVSAADHTDPNFSLLTHGSGKVYKIGDTLDINSNYVRVLFSDPDNNQIKTTKDATIASSDTITRPGISAIVIRQDDTLYYPLFGRDYSVTYASQTNDIIKVTFISNFEANVSLPNPLNPGTDTVYFRAYCDTGKSLAHGDVLKEIIEESGLTVNSASITAANSALSVDTNFYIPYRLDSGFPSISGVTQSLLNSTLGYIYLNNSLEIGYDLFAAPSTSTEVTDREILLDTYSVEVDYSDIRNSIIPENDHDIYELDFSNAGEESTKATYLHEVVTQKTYKHLLASASKMSDTLALLAERKALYSFVSKIRLDAIINDQFKIVKDNILGNVASTQIQTSKLNKKTSEINVAGFDLLGL